MTTNIQLASLGINPDDYANLSEDELKVVESILTDISNGNTDQYNELYYSDYEEIPVDFITFINDNRYLGKSTKNGTLIYDFWKKEGTRIVDGDEVEVALSGCLSGDTVIPLINGQRVTIKELAESRAKKFKVYSYDLNTNKFTVGTAVRAFSTGIKKVYAVTFDNGETIRITGTHKFLTRDKHYKSIDDGITVGDSIMPFNYYLNERGYEIIKHPQKDGSVIEEPTHRMVMRYKIGDFKGVVHHKNYKKRDNSPENLIRMEWYQHKHFHAIRGGQQFREFNQKIKEGKVSEDVLQRMHDGALRGLINRWSDPEQHRKMSERISIQNIGNIYGSHISEEDREVKRQRRVKYNKEEHPSVLNLLKVTKEQVIDAIKSSYTFNQVQQKLNISNCGLSSLLKRYEINIESLLKKTTYLPIPSRYWTPVLSQYNSLLTEYGTLNDKIVAERLGTSGRYPKVSNVVHNYFNDDYDSFINLVKDFNHKIIKIEELGYEEVYDIEVERYHNFALEAGVVVHNSIGTGKSTAACVMIAYLLYKLMCLRDPQSFFNMRVGSKITVALLNNTLASSYGVGFDTLQSLLCNSPWFLDHGTVAGRTDETKHYVPSKGFEIVVGSRVQHTIGHSVALALIDEINFAPGQDTSYQKSKIMSLYANIRQRLNSRFIVQGKNYGKLFLVSSKATEYSFLEAYIADQQRKGYPIYVVDKPRWEIKPFMYSGKTFKVAVGNKYLPSRIVPDHLTPDELDEYCKGLESQGLKIIDVPIEEKQSFDQDIDRALQDAAGIATSAVTKAFNSQKVLNAISNVYTNPFTVEVVSLGMNDSLQLKDFFDVSKIPDFIYGCPVFIHLDASVSGDRTGLAGTAIIGTRQSVNAFAEEDEDKIVDELMCQEVFHVMIEPPADAEISFEKTRQFIYYLKDEVGLNIKHVSTDGFQSVDTRQILSTKGFEVGYTSLDRTPDGYDGLRSAIYDKRMILLGNGAKLFEELTELERDNMSRKYDHNRFNTKDGADALAGSHMDAMAYKQEYMFFHPDDYDYEGINETSTEEEKIKNDLIRSIAPVEKPITSRPSRDDFFDTSFQESAQVNRKPIDPADIFSEIDQMSRDDGDILFL